MKSLLGLTSRVRTTPFPLCMNALKRGPIQYTIFGASTFATISNTVKADITNQTTEEAKIHEMVSEYYGKTLETNADLKTNACCASEAPPLTIREALKKVPTEITQKYYGCGSPLPFGIEGLTVLDLGSGSGQDCYIAAQLVGENGKVIGIDMTDEQLAVSKKYINEFCCDTLGYKQPNLEFIKGYIEMLPQYLKPGSIDIIISNCVVNLSPRKDKVCTFNYPCTRVMDIGFIIYIGTLWSV